jgi:hypothetical protein
LGVPSGLWWIMIWYIYIYYHTYTYIYDNIYMCDIIYRWYNIHIIMYIMDFDISFIYNYIYIVVLWLSPKEIIWKSWSPLFWTLLIFVFETGRNGAVTELIRHFATIPGKPAIFRPRPSMP